MPSQAASVALELEVLLERAARQGRLAIDDILDAYVRLAPVSHPGLGNRRQVDLRALVEAIESLPEGFFEAPRVMVVPRLEGFTVAWVPSRAMRAGRLSDGSLLVEARFGLASLSTLAIHLAAIAHEHSKARALLDETPWHDAERVSAEGEQGVAESAPDAGPPNDATDDVDSQEAAGRSMAALSFALGVQEHALRAANARTEGVLLRTLLCVDGLPEVTLHAEMDAASRTRRARRASERIVAAVAEAGLAGRPLHLWIGRETITDCLSPYARELRPALLDWATAMQPPPGLGDDVTAVGGTAGEDALYAIAHDFLRSDPRLWPERCEADRTVGILRHEVDGALFDVVDLGRLDPSVLDSRIGPLRNLQGRGRGGAPVLLRVGYNSEDSEATAVRAVLDAYAGSLQSITTVLEGFCLDAPPGTIMLPFLMIRWGGQHKLTVPSLTGLAPEDFRGVADDQVQVGAVLSMPSIRMLSEACLQDLAPFAVGAVDVDSSGLVAALSDALWAGTLGQSTDMAWVLVGSQETSTQRPSVASLTAHSAVAVVRLRRLFSPPLPPPPPPEPSPPPERPPPASSRMVRIKA